MSDKKFQFKDGVCSTQVNGVMFHEFAGQKLGVVPFDKLVRRRTNYKQMTEAQKKALRANLDEFGFKGFCPVEVRDDGTFGMIDGHHRWEELEARGANGLPVVLIDGDPTRLDLAMFGFNVVGDNKPHEFLDMVRELATKTSVDDVATFAALSPEFLRDLEEATQRPIDVPVMPDEVSDTPAPRKAPKPSWEALTFYRDDESATPRPAFTVRVPKGFELTTKIEDQAAQLGMTVQLGDCVEAEREGDVIVALMDFDG